MITSFKRIEVDLTIDDYWILDGVVAHLGNRQLAVLFKYGPFDVANIRDTFRTLAKHQIISTHPIFEGRADE